jgi:ubiquinone/menaquinone biosynthesis C-methylase UbiE
MKRIREAEPEWWQNLFDADWNKIFAYKKRDVQKESNSIVKLLRLPRGRRILDLGYGDGRISIALARLGYKVTGLDHSKSLLDKARQKALREDLEIEWLQGNMRDIGFTDSYDSAISIFTSFGYFPDETDDLKVLRSVIRGLKKGGKLIIDVENIFFVSRVAQTYGRERMYRPVENHRGWVEEITDLDPVLERVNMSLRLWLPKNRVVKTAQASYRIYTLPELRKLLEKAGFTFDRVYGDFRLSEYDLNSERMIVLALKPA